MSLSGIMNVFSPGMSGFLNSLSPNYTGAADDYSNRINQLADSYNPYINQGFMAKKGMAGLGALNMMAPAAPENRLASGYTNSPYQNQIQHNTSDMMDMNAAKTGMLGSTSEDAALQNQLAGQQDQWQQQYINRGMHQYDMGEQNLMGIGTLMANQGFSATNHSNMMRTSAALAKMRANMMPTGSQEFASGVIGDGMGAIMGML